MTQMRRTRWTARRPATCMVLCGLLAALGALTSIVANRIATELWTRFTGEDPPVD